MTKYIFTILIGILIGSITMYFFFPQTIIIEKNTIQKVLTLEGPVKYNCELSGGTFTNNSCICPIESFQTQEEMYNKSTGFCQSTVGGPAGNAFWASAGLPWGYYTYYSQIVTKLCEDSGGTKSGAACICPDNTQYSKISGTCTMQ